MYGTKVYIGKILGNDEDVRKLLQLPKHEDRIWIDRQNIICSVLEPSPTGKSRRMYKLSESDLKNIERGAGNVMFKIAALIGVAKRHGFLPRTTFDNHRIFKWFELPPIYYKFPATNSILVKEERHEYQTVVETLDTSRNWTLDAVNVCVHVRRGDMLQEVAIKRGNLPTDPAYLKRSIDFFRNRFNNRTVNFVIISDDIKWCKISTSGPDVFYSPFQTDVLDFALMVCCDHVIVTMGTFGWWGAWLSGGITWLKKTSPYKKDKGKDVFKSMLFLFPLLLAIALDVESNPGPVQTGQYLEGNSTVFPCGNCQTPVAWTCKGVQCDMCNVWFHANCQNIDESMYDRLGNSSGVGVWKCTICENVNITLNSTPSLDSLETPNPFENLNQSNSSDLSFSMAHTSTPKRNKEPKSQKSKMSTKNNIKRSIKVLIVNYRSVVDKKHERDRVTQAGGGVFIAVRDCINAQEMPELQSNCEDLWTKVDLVGNKPLIIGAYYKPRELDTSSSLEFAQSLAKVNKKSLTFGWLGI
ncbi:FUT1-like protein [Mya arenaria]|uniref:L-Fucosyltransferase n=1 Tax=Mya arenaria TaxID=6604 RepID=A0ABY7GFM1_MYAAR|nr:FUT1-like protein [Mya arenaria]